MSNTITIKDPNGNIVCSVENVNASKSKEDFPVIENESIANKHDEIFDKYCKQAFKSLIGKKIKSTTITTIEPFNRFSNGVSVTFNKMDEFYSEPYLIYDLEDMLNKCITNCPLNKFYAINFNEDGLSGDSADFICNIEPKK